MNDITHATIIPLIGGEVLASDAVWNNRPEYILSYSPFEANEVHLRNYYNHEMPYLVLDHGDTAPKAHVNIISSICPCAGLSQYHAKPGEGNPNNQWMRKTAKYILGKVKPDVMWGENASGLVGKIGKFMLDELRQISLENGYSMSTYLTKNLSHGVPQFRRRAFYFFWKKSVFGEKTPLLNYFDRPYEKIEDVISGVNSNSQMEPITEKTPSKDDPYYRYLLEEVHGGITHREYSEILTAKNARGNDVESMIEEQKHHKYDDIGAWMLKEGYDREASKCKRKFEKLAAGGNIMRRGTIIPKDRIGAFVGHYPTVLTHPYEDRYITYREAMTIMGLPDDYELLNPKKSVNHICQNVHYLTATDMATEIKESLAGNRPWVNTDFLFQNNNSKSYEDWSTPVTASLEKHYKSQ
jgi:site-specific DNA-cytosine methylase